MESVEQKQLFREIYNDVLKISIQTSSDINNYNCTYGPINCGNWKCSYSPDGVCRMLVCQCCENDDDNNENDTWSWFNGKCNFCECEIPNKKIALRIPLEGGGWYGCFCSISCIQDSYISDDSEIQKIFLIQSLISNLQICPISLIDYSFTVEEEQI